MKADEGNYTCVAENIAGKVTMNLTLIFAGNLGSDWFLRPEENSRKLR